MDARRSSYRQFGTAVVSVVMPLLLAFINIFIVLVDVLELIWVKMFERTNNQIARPNRQDADERMLQEPNDFKPIFNEGNRSSRSERRHEQSVQRIHPPRSHQTDNNYRIGNERPNIKYAEERDLEELINVEPRFHEGSRSSRSEIRPQQPVQRRSSPRSHQTDNNENLAIRTLQLLDDGVVQTIQQARLVLNLISLQFSEAEAIDAAKHSSSVDSAIAYLNHECEACNRTFPMSQMIDMLNCTHRCCRTCARNFFSLQITHHSVLDCICPYCRLPDLRSAGTSKYDIKEYFANISVVFENVLNADVYGVFKKKMRTYLSELGTVEPSSNNGHEGARRDVPNVSCERLQQSVPAQPTSPSSGVRPRTPNQFEEPTEFEIMQNNAHALVRDKKVKDFAQAELAVTLMSMQFSEDQSLDASRNCTTLDNAISYLNQDCPRCNETYSMGQMISLLNCDHRICRACLKNHFTEKIVDHDITDLNCPICELPNLSGDDMSEDDVSTYLGNIDILLKDLLDADVHEQFQQKMRNFALKDDPDESAPLSEPMQRQARQFVEEGLVRNYRQSELAIRLIQLGHSKNDALLAVKICSTLDGAIAFLDQECEICAEKFRMPEMVTMLNCEHRCCIECTRNYFNVQINEHSILDCNCPFCQTPDLKSDEMEEHQKNYYYSNLDIILRNVLDPAVHEIFQKKLRDWSLSKDPNFKWCPQCSSGYISEQIRGMVICPDCRANSCISCRKPWQDQHEGISCEQFARWETENDPENQATALANHLATNGIDCPKCKHRFTLARGGCMHFTCSQCKHEFCQGCARPFSTRCSVSGCRLGSGLHAHHPRNCLYFLRDRDPEELESLLRKHKVAFNTERPANSRIQNCYLPLTSTNGRETYCNQTVREGHAGLCRIHYNEYLCKLMLDSGNIDRP